MVLVLDAHAPVEGDVREARNVSGGEDVVASVDAAILVDDDPVVHPESCRLGKLDVRLDAETGATTTSASSESTLSTFSPVRTSTPFSR